MIYRRREGEQIRNGINLDWGQHITFFQLILHIPFYKSHKFYKGKDWLTGNYCLMRDEYCFAFYFRIRSWLSFKHLGKPFIIETHFFKRPYYSKIIATREQLRNYKYA